MTQSKRVPTPRCVVLVNVIDSASAIQSTWRSIGSITRQTSAGDASIVMPTLQLHASRSIGRAVSGATGLTSTPVPISKPPITPSRGTMSIQQWNGRGSSRGAVFTTTLYAILAQQRRVQAQSASCSDSVRARTSSSVARSKRAPPAGQRDPDHETARSRRGGHHETAAAVAHQARTGARVVDRVGDEVAAGVANRASELLDVRRSERERDELRVRVLDRRARRAGRGS